MAPTIRLLLSLIFISIQISLCVSVQKNQNITLGSTLSPSSQNSKWVSPNGHFAFGFYQQTPTLYVLGVWFDSISPKTLAWTVLKDNIDIPVGKKSSLQLTERGLSLYSDDMSKNVVWSSEISEKVAMAAVLDNGNFVLLNALFETIWQSFDYPTDTLLPGQTLKSSSNMFSKASTSNFSAGRFELSMQGDSNLVLYPVERRGDSESSYWNTGTSQLQPNELSLRFEPSGLLYLVNSTNITIFKVTEGKAGEGRFLRRLTLEIDGTIAQYVWNIDTNDSSWLSVWQRPSKDPCKDVKGQCGNNAICRLTDQNKPDCICPPQFSFIDKEDHFRGCIRSSSAGLNCSTKSSMSLLENTNWLPNSDYAVLQDLSEIQCKLSCLKDCMCVVVAYDNAVCRKKQLPLVDGRQALEITTRAFVKVPENFNGDPSVPQLLDQGKKREGKTLVVIGVALLGFSASLLVAAFIVTWLCGNKLSTRKGKIPQQPEVVEGLTAFSYKEIEAATDGFRQELGRGAFAKVYKGKLPDGRAIAVKNLLDNVSQGEHGERDFRMEMRVIGTSHHRNLVQLYGFCDEASHRLLVYEYMSNGSLDAALFVDSGFLDWRTRIQIAMGIARGLLYLHEECKTQILHCDIKPQNILLDQNYSPKISDFGLAKLLKADQTATLTVARGTKGYIAPEWINKMPITVKVDVYSFGVMLLEIICCRKSIDLGAPENRIFLSDWAYECLKGGRFSELVEQQQVEVEGGEYNRIDSRQLERMVLVGLWCIQEDPGLRPYIKKVVQMMEGTVEIAVPPAPGSFVSSLSI